MKYLQLNLPRMKEIKEDLKKRRIKVEFLDIPSFYKDVDKKQIDEIALETSIRQISPQMVFILICFSQILDLRFLLEGAGILSEIRMSRDLKLISKGKILTLNDTQKELLQTVSNPENVHKDVWIEGRVGSGKTLLGIEVIRIKLAHYLRKYGLSAAEGQQQIQVVIQLDRNAQYEGSGTGTGSCHELLEQLEHGIVKELEHCCTITTDNSNGNPKLSEDVKHRIVMIDEEWFSNPIHIQSTESHRTDYIICIRHADVGKMYRTLDKDVKNTMEDIVFCRLRQCQRSSQNILNIANHLRVHSDGGNRIPLRFGSNDDSFAGRVPEWIVAKDVSAFMELASSEYSGYEDVLLILDQDTQYLAEITALASHLNWKISNRRRIKGTEADMVIVWDHRMFDYEVFTRARLHLVIMTLVGSIHEQNLEDLDENKDDPLSHKLMQVVNGIHHAKKCRQCFETYEANFGKPIAECSYNGQPEQITKLVKQIFIGLNDEEMEGWKMIEAQHIANVQEETTHIK